MPHRFEIPRSLILPDIIGMPTVDLQGWTGRHHEVQRAVAGQQDFVYCGRGRDRHLTLWLNGVCKLIGVDYFERGPRHILFASPLEEGDLVSFLCERNHEEVAEGSELEDEFFGRSTNAR